MFKRLTITIFVLLLMFPSTSHAQPTLYDWVVGGTLKNFAKIYVKTSNLPKLKAKYIQKIANMKEDKFQKYFGKFLAVYQQLPGDIKKTYVFTENTNKSEVIDTIDRVNKRDLIAIINKIPSEFVVKQAKYYSHQSQDQLAQHPQANAAFLWNRIVQRI